MFSIRLRSLVVLCAFAVSTPVFAQSGEDAAKSGKKKGAAKTPKGDGIVSRFFQTAEPITATLTRNVKRTKGDKSADAPWRPATLSCAAVSPHTGTVTIPTRIRTRGIWRLKNCE